MSRAAGEGEEPPGVGISSSGDGEADVLNLEEHWYIFVGQLYGIF